MGLRIKRNALYWRRKKVLILKGIWDLGSGTNPHERGRYIKGGREIDRGMRLRIKRKALF